MSNKHKAITTPITATYLTANTSPLEERSISINFPNSDKQLIAPWSWLMHLKNGNIRGVNLTPIKNGEVINHSFSDYWIKKTKTGKGLYLYIKNVCLMLSWKALFALKFGKFKFLEFGVATDENGKVIIWKDHEPVDYVSIEESGILEGF